MAPFSRKAVITFFGILILISGLWFLLRGDDSSSTTVAEDNAALDELAESFLDDDPDEDPDPIQPDNGAGDNPAVDDPAVDVSDTEIPLPPDQSLGDFVDDIFEGDLDGYLLVSRDTTIDGAYLPRNYDEDFDDADSGGVSFTRRLRFSRRDQPSGLAAADFPEVVIGGASGQLSATDEPTRSRLYNNTEYGCGETENGHRTICASGAPIESDQLTVFMLLEGSVPLDDTGNHQYTYALVLDADGQPDNNFVAQPPFDWDTYQGSDYWIELIGENNEWRLQVTNWAAGDQRGTTVSSARAVVEANAVFFVVPLSDLPGIPTGYRVTTFVTQLDRMFDPEVSGVDSFPGPPDFGLHPIAPELVPLLIDTDG